MSDKKKFGKLKKVFSNASASIAVSTFIYLKYIAEKTSGKQDYIKMVMNFFVQILFMVQR